MMRQATIDRFQSGKCLGQLVGFQAMASTGMVGAHVTEAREHDARYLAISAIDTSFHGSPEEFEAVMIVHVEHPKRGRAMFEVRRPYVMCSSSSDEHWAEKILDGAARALGFERNAQAA